MTHKRSEKRRRSSPTVVGETSDSPLSRRAVVAWVLLGASALVFFLAPVPELNGQSRVMPIIGTALTIEECIPLWFGDPAEFAIGDRLWVALPAVAMLVVCGLAGRLMLAALRVDRRLSQLDAIFFSCTAGLALASLYTFAVGIAGGLQQRWFFLAPAAAIVLGYIAWRTRLSAVRGFEAPRSNEPTANRWLWWAAPFAAAMVLGGTLTPLDFDVREYHLQVPKEFYQQGAISFLPHNVYGNMPSGTEMLSLAAMSALGDWWRGALVGKTVIALCGPLAALGVLAAARRFVSPIAGVVAALAYISIPWIARVSELGLVEGVSALYLWGTVYALLLWWRECPASNWSFALLAGWLAGSAAACKYPNVVFVLIPATAAVAVRLWKPGTDTNDAGSPLRRFIPLATFLLAASTACGPWFAKNWVLTGNPTYPLLYSVFDGRTRTPERHAQWVRAHRPPGYAPAQLLDSAANLLWRSAWISPLVLPMALLGLLFARDRRLALALAAYTAFVIVTWWLFTHRIDRFWIPISPVLAMLAGLSVGRGAPLTWRWPLKSYLAACFAVNLLVVVTAGGGDPAYFVSLDHLQQNSRISDWHQYLNRHLTDRDVLLMVGDALAFDMRMPVLYNTVFDADRFEQLMRDRTAAERRAALAELGITYVAVDWAEIARYRSPGNYGFTDYIQPALFAELIGQQVLDPPLDIPEASRERVTYQIFPVHGASTPKQPAGPALPNRSDL